MYNIYIFLHCLSCCIEESDTRGEFFILFVRTFVRESAGARHNRSSITKPFPNVRKRCLRWVGNMLRRKSIQNFPYRRCRLGGQERHTVVCTAQRNLCVQKRAFSISLATEFLHYFLLFSCSNVEIFYHFAQTILAQRLTQRIAASTSTSKFNPEFVMINFQSAFYTPITCYITRHNF